MGKKGGIRGFIQRELKKKHGVRSYVDATNEGRLILDKHDVEDIVLYRQELDILCDEMKQIELKKLCKQRGLKQTGKKLELLHRLANDYASAKPFPIGASA